MFNHTANTNTLTINNNELTRFFFENNHEIRTMNHEGTPLFVAKDVAHVLGYKRTDDAIRRHCKKAVDANAPKRGGAPLKLIPESDVYRLIIKSKLKTAEKFEEWVMEEVLPSIRKNGAYVSGQEQMSSEIQEVMFQHINNNLRPMLADIDRLIPRGSNRLEEHQRVITEVAKRFNMPEIIIHRIAVAGDKAAF